MSRRVHSKAFLSIGDVVDSLKEEFSDVTVSKIRFFETEGLIDPERTPSGYRKFYPGDVARLRYILRVQRDQFMPLKVIRQRLEHFDPGDLASEAASPGVTPAPHASTAEFEDEDMSLEVGLHMSLEDLVSSSGLDESLVRELEEYGLIDAHSMEGGVYYDEEDLMVARIARDFAKYGIEPRHMRMYRNFADREAGIFEQIVLPRSRADNGRQVTQSLNELMKLSKRLKHILLKASLSEHLSS